MASPNNTPSDPTTPDPWSDLDIVPTPPGKDHYQAQYLYKGSAKASDGTGVYALFFHPLAATIAVLGLVLLLGMTWYDHHQRGVRQEAMNAKLQADMNAFKRTMAVQGLTATCLATPRDQVPHQYFGECQAVVKAHAAKKEARP